MAGNSGSTGADRLTVAFRLAPEDPFPAAVEDSWEAVRWVKESLGAIVAVDVSRLAVGGSSAGGNLAAVMTQKCVERGTEVFASQFLIVPVLDNTATTATRATWKRLEFTAGLPAAKMMWYRKHYLPEEKDWGNVEASPLLWKGDWKKLPAGLIVMGGMDLLRGEGEEYAGKLKEAGVETEVKIMEGMPHPFLAMDGILQAGKDAITAICDTLKTAFD